MLQEELRQTGISLSFNIGNAHSTAEINGTITQRVAITDCRFLGLKFMHSGQNKTEVHRDSVYHLEL